MKIFVTRPRGQNSMLHKNFLGSLFLGILLLAGTAWAQDEAMQSGGTLTASVAQDISNVDPYVVSSHTDFNILRHIYEGLVTLNANLEVIPMLADSWEVRDDGKIYTFTLRKGVRFHDGSEMTASDVKYSLGRFLEMSVRSGELSRITAIDVIDDYTIELTLDENDAAFLANLANPYVVAIFPEGTNPAENPIGTGPFRFVERRVGDRVVLERFDEYAPSDLPASGLGGHKEALVDRLVFRVIADSQSTVAGLQTGELDFVSGLPAQDVERLKATARGFEIVEQPGTFLSLLYFNSEAPLMEDKRFRQAVLYALDREVLLEATYWGYGEVASSVFPPSTAWFTDVHANDPYQYDPDTARRLLEEMGYDGQVVHIGSQNADQRRQALAIQEQLRNVGINSEVNHVEPAVYSSYLFDGGFQILSSGSGLRIDPEQRYSFWHCERSSLEFGYCNPEYDRIVDEARTALDFEARRELYAQAERILKDDAVVGPLYYRNTLYGISERVQGFEANPYDWVQFFNVWLNE